MHSSSLDKAKLLRSDDRRGRSQRGGMSIAQSDRVHGTKTDPLSHMKTQDIYGPVKPATSPALGNAKHDEDDRPIFVKTSKDKSEGKKTKRPKGSKRKSKKSGTIIVPKKRRMKPKGKPKPPGGFFYTVKRTLTFIAFFILGIIALYIFVGLQNLDHFGRDIERFAKNKLNLDMQIAGSVDLLMPMTHPGFFIEDVSLRIGEGGDERLSYVRRFEMRLNIASLFEQKERLDLIQLRFVGADIGFDMRNARSEDLESLMSLTTDLLDAMPEWLGSVTMKDLVFERSRVHVLRSDGTTAVTIPVQQAQFWSEDDQVRLSISGQSGIESYRVGGSVKGVETLQSGGLAALDITGDIGSTYLIASGEFSLAEATTSALQLQVLGSEFTGPFGLMGFDAIDEAPFALSLDLEGQIWGEMQGQLSGYVGESSALGQIILNNTDQTNIDVTLSADYLDLASLAPMLSGMEQTARDESGERTDNAPPQKTVPPLLLGALSFDIREVRAGDVNLGPLEWQYQFTQQGGSMTLMQGGEGFGFAVVSATQRDQDPWGMTASVSNFNIGAVISSLMPDRVMDGTVHLAADLEFAQNDEMAGFPIARGGYQMVLFADKVGNDLDAFFPERIINLMYDQNALSKTEDSLCVLSRASMEEGRLLSHAFYLETNDVMTSGSGYFDFIGDDVKFVLRPRPKDPRLLASAADIEIGGRLSQPRIKRNDRKIARGLSSALSVKTEVEDSIALPYLSVDRTGHESCLIGLLEDNTGE